jgi:hypothetical protein
VTKDGIIVTNYHVIAEGTSAVVKLPDGAFYVVDGILASDKARDLAVIKAHGENFRTLSLGDSDHVQVGQEVVAIGNPLSLESTVSSGIVSSIRTIDEKGGKYLQVTAPISPGSSGGPLLNMEGQVVGITTMYLKGGENLNFAIPVNDARRLLLSVSAKAQKFPNGSEKSLGEKPAHPPITAEMNQSHLDEARVNILYCRENPAAGVIDDSGQMRSCSSELAYLRAFCGLNPKSELCKLPDAAVAMERAFQKQFDDLAEDCKNDKHCNKDAAGYYDKLFGSLRKRACMSFPEVNWPVRNGAALPCP